MIDSMEVNSVERRRKFYLRENSDEMIKCDLIQSSLNFSNCSLLHPDSREDENPFDIKMTSIAKVEATEY